jgi:hypothetical protein
VSAAGAKGRTLTAPLLIPTDVVAIALVTENTAENNVVVNTMNL